MQHGSCNVAPHSLPERELTHWLVKQLLDPQQGESIAIFVGPEGGWTGREREQLAASGWQAVSLGPQILRAETAAVVAIALAAHAWETG